MYVPYCGTVKLIFDSWLAHLKTGLNDINGLVEF